MEAICTVLVVWETGCLPLRSMGLSREGEDRKTACSRYHYSTTHPRPHRVLDVHRTCLNQKIRILIATISNLNQPSKAPSCY